MNSSCEMKSSDSSGHEFLNTQYKNHSRYIIFPSRPTIIIKELNMGIKEKQPKKNQEHTWQKILWAKKIREFNLTKREVVASKFI